jgi:hypothetical protein
MEGDWFTDEEGFVCRLADDGSVIRAMEGGRPIRLLQGDELNKFLKELGLI